MDHLTTAPSTTEGTFEFIEAKIRRESDGTLFSIDFEWLCKWFLENAPRYRGKFEKVWPWYDWPDRWGPECGIDIVAQTRAGELWAVQAKAVGPDHSIRKAEIDSFLAESSRPEFSFRLLIATTDKIGRNARNTLKGQTEKPVGELLRGALLTEEVKWPAKIGGKAVSLPRYRPRRPHQTDAIKAVVNGFKEHDRGQLIMACGTGKTLVALWTAEQRKSALTLVLVPSLSLVSQNLGEWGRHAKADFDSLVVCSHESVRERRTRKRRPDTLVQSTADLGVDVTTDPEQIRKFLNKRRNRPAVVFATYHSSERIAEAQDGRSRWFDLAICDETHRLAGNATGLFGNILYDDLIKVRKRLFMTATPRYFTDRVKQKANEQEFEIASMDDHNLFGPPFHTLTFHEAMSADPPLLTDYQVVVIGVTDREAKALADKAQLVHSETGLTTDARTLAAQIGLAKAMKKHDLRRIITFHSSVLKARNFTDETLPDSLPEVVRHLSRSARPAGKLWARHISGKTPAGIRQTRIKGLGDLPDKTRGIVSNCQCLGEGVDVPALDGVAFIDPKRSTVDIIQAVGRVIRKAKDKEVGTIVIPVFIDETEEEDDVLSQSEFRPVWQVLKALRAHDGRLGDELDQLRLSLGQRPKSGGRIKLPDNIILDIPSQLSLRNFEQAFYVRTIEQTTLKPPLTIEQILEWADAHREDTGKWPANNSGPIKGTTETWNAIDSALKIGFRDLPGGSSVSKLLDEHRGDDRNLTIDQILKWVDAYKKKKKKWPTGESGPIEGAEETWKAIDAALNKSNRGLPGGSSLAKLLDEHRGDDRNLTIDQILEWADAYKKDKKKWPISDAGAIKGTTITWNKVNSALRNGNRRLPGGSSLSKLLDEHRRSRITDLTIEQILEWADAHKKETTKWPTQKSGTIKDTTEAWSRINRALRNGYRRLPGGSSLAKLLDEHRRKI